MKYLILLLALVACLAQAQEVPKYLKDGTITVTLKDGKSYSFPANDYAVVRRGSKQVEPKAPELAAAEPAKKSAPQEQKRLKHIISGELVHSNSGELNTKSTPSTIDVENKKKLGVGVQYQYNLVDDLFLGGRIDTNGGTAVNVGVGF